MSKTEPFATAILLAGGSSSRMEGSVPDKILFEINGESMLHYSICAFAACETVDSLVIVYRDKAQKEAIEQRVSLDAFKNVAWAKGGSLRQDSVWSGLSAIDQETEVVLIHDGARPLITSRTIDDVARAARTHQAACVAKKTTDTIKQATPSGSAHLLHTLDRSQLWAMETPQAFAYPLIKDAYEKVIRSGQPITDDVSAIEADNIPVVLIEADSPNPKLTTEQDLPLFEFLLNRPSAR